MKSGEIRQDNPLPREGKKLRELKIAQYITKEELILVASRLYRTFQRQHLKNRQANKNTYL